MDGQQADVGSACFFRGLKDSVSGVDRRTQHKKKGTWGKHTRSSVKNFASSTIKQQPQEAVTSMVKSIGLGGALRKLGGQCTARTSVTLQYKRSLNNICEVEK